MHKSIFMYSLLAFGYFGFLTILVTKVSAQTIAITSGNNQSTTRGQNFSSAVSFTVTNGGNPVANESVSFGLHTDTPNTAQMSATATGTFTATLNLATNASGVVTIHIKANTDPVYDKCTVGATILVGVQAISAFFDGKITDVLYFSSDGTVANKITSTTRSVNIGTAANTNIGAAVSATHYRNADADMTNNVTLAYSSGGGTDDALFNISSTTGQLTAKAASTLSAVTSYSVKVKVEEKGGGTTARSSATIDVTISVTNPPPPSAPTGLSATAGDGQVRLSWTAPAGPITRYEYTQDGGANWTSTNSTSTTYTVTNLTNDTPYAFQVRAVNSGGTGTASTSVTATPQAGVVLPPPPPPQNQPVNTPGNTQSSVETEPATEQTPPKRKIRYECPVGWTRGSVFGKTPKALIYELKVNIDRTNRISIYELTSLAIYVHPDEDIETLDGWTLKVGTLYNQFGKEFKLTAENSVIDEHNFAHIENPEEIPIPMGTLGYIGQSLPSFDYRLYDAQGVRVDFGISCYKTGGLTFRLWNTKDPRLLRVLPLGVSEEALSVQMQSLDWQTPFFRSEWTAAIMPDLPAAPAAPSQIKGNIVGTWGDLKKQ